MNPQLRITLILATLTALAPFAIDTYLPAFSFLALDLHTSLSAIQQSLTVYLLPYALMTLVYGPVSDSIGRLNTLRIGLSVFTLASVGCALSTSVTALWGFRILQGLSAGASNVVARAMVRDLFEGVQAQRVMAVVQMLFSIAPAIAPIIGGLLLGVGWRMIFIFLAAYALLAMLLGMRYLPETMPQEKRLSWQPVQVFARYKTLFSHRRFCYLAIAQGANFSAFFVYVLASPVFLIHHLKLAPQDFYLLFVSTVSGMFLGAYLARYSAGRYSKSTTLRIAYLWMIGWTLINVLACLILPDIPWVRIAPISLFNIGMGLAMPILSLAGLELFPTMRGTASSGQIFVQMVFSTLSAGLIVPWVWHSTVTLSLAMLAYLLLGIWAARKAHIVEYSNSF